MNDYSKYINYLMQNSSLLNKKLKQTINVKNDELIRLMLIDYIIETIENYDYRNCPGYNDIEGPITPEMIIFYFKLEGDGGEIRLEDGENIYFEFNRQFADSEVLINEPKDKYLSLEEEQEKYIFDKNYIESYLYKLIKNLDCNE